MKRTMVLAAIMMLILAGNVFGQNENGFDVQQLSNGTLRINGFARGVKATIRDGTFTVPRELFGIRVTSLGEDFKFWVSDYYPELKRIIVPDTITEINGVFRRWWHSDRSSVQELRIPGSVTVLGNYTFSIVIEGTVDVVIPSSVRKIGSNMFGSIFGGKMSVRELVIEGVIQEVGGGLCLREDDIERIIFPANWNNDKTLNDLDLPENFVNFYKSQNRKGGVYVRRGQIWTFDASARYTPRGYGGVFMTEAARQEIARQEAARQKEAQQDAARQAAYKYKQSGDAAYDKKDYDKAIADYTEAIRIYPGYELAYIQRSWAYRHKGDYDKAIADCNEVIRIYPESDNAYLHRAGIYNNKGEYDKAIADCNEAIRLKPNDFYNYYQRAFAYNRKGDFRQAREDLNKYLQVSPNFQGAKDLDAELKRKGY